LGDPEHESAVLTNLGAIAYLDGRWDDAIELYGRAGAASERAGRPSDAAYTDCNVGEILSDQGRFDEAEERLRRARRVWSATGEQQGVAFVDVLLARVAVRRGGTRQSVPALRAASDQFRRFRLDAYAEFAQALLAEAEAVAGDPLQGLEIARSELATSDRHRALLERVSGIALARLEHPEEAAAHLGHALGSARRRGAAYDIAAAIDGLRALDCAGPELLRERDEILARLRIERLPMLHLPGR